MKPKQTYIAVVMAAYNAADTIEAAIRSVLEQDFSDFRLLIVDDGSTDDTAAVALRTIAGSDNATLIRQPENRGKAAALTRAFDYDEPVYFACCDADDRMRPGALRAMSDAAELHSADIVIAPYVLHRGNRTSTVRPRARIENLDDMPLDTVHFALWNKLIRGDILRRHAMPFEGIDRWEDLGIVARAMVAPAVRMPATVIDTPVYDYYVRSGVATLSRSGKSALLADRMAMTDRLIRWFADHGLTDTHSEFLDHLRFCAKTRMAGPPRRDLKLWARTYPEVNGRIMQLRHIGLMRRLAFTLIARIYGR